MEKEQIERIKTGIIIALAIIVVIGIVYILSGKVGGKHDYEKPTVTGGNQIQEKSNPLLEDGEVLPADEAKDLKDLTLNGLKKAMSNKETLFVFIGRDSCGWCNYQHPILEYISYKYNVEINYLNVETWGEAEYTELAKMHEELQSFGTPTFLIIKNGRIETVDTGARGTSAMVDLLKANGYIK